MIPSWGSKAFSRTDGDKFACFLDFSSDAWCFRDLEGYFTYINSSFLTMSQVSEDSQLILKTLDVMDVFSKEQQKNLIKIENRVILSKKAIVFPVWGISFGGYKNPILNIKISPFFSLDESVLFGTCWHCYIHHFIPFRKVLDHKVNEIKKFSSPYDIFSVRQWTVIWLFYMGWSHKEIAHHLNINEKSSQQLLYRSYVKIGVSSSSELRRIIISNAWDSEVPTY